VLATWRRRLLLARLVAIGVGQALAATVTVLAIERTFQGLVLGEGGKASFSAATVAGYGAVLLAAAGLAAWLRLAERTDAERLGQDYVHDLRMAMYDRLGPIGGRALTRRSQGGVNLRFTGDLTALRQWVSLGLARLVVATTFCVGALAALALMNVRLACAVGAVLLISAGGTQAIGRPLQKAARRARRRRTRLAANVNEQVAAVDVVQALGGGSRERRRLERQSRRLRGAMVRRARLIGALRAVSEGTALAAGGVALVAGSAEVAAGRASPGTVVAAMSVVGLLVPALRDLGRVPEYWHGSRVSLEKLRDFLATPAEVRERADAVALGPGPGRLELCGVGVDGALDGLTATAEPGQVIAIVGPNGSGKSTLLSVAGRLLDPHSGSVLLDGEDVAHSTVDSVRDAVSMAGPDLPLLRGTVGRNLRYRRPDASPEELQRVREIVSLDELVAELPKGEKARVSDGGRGLSAGQRARIALGRALLGDCRVLLLDEVEANLDARAAGAVERAVEDRRGRTTLLVVTHRPAMVRRADVVWHLEDGRLVETGSPEELMTGGGPTARLLGPRQAPVRLAPRAQPAAGSQASRR